VKRLVLLAAVASCSGGSSNQHIAFAHLSFEVPHDWANQDSKWHGLATSVWTPSENERKESVTVMRSERARAVALAGSQMLEGLVANAQRALPDARVSAVVPVSTRGGLSGMRVDLDYVPPGLREHYHRVHVVLIDGNSLVHVLYTAKAPDQAMTTFNLVLDTLREEG
jgi:hypothetical protein